MRVPVAIALLVGCREPKAGVIALHAVTADAAVVVLRDPDHSRLGRIDGHGALVWSADIPGSVPALDASSALAVGDGIVIVRHTLAEVARPTEQWVTAFALGDGHVVWSQALPSTAGFFYDPASQPIIAGDRIHLVTADRVAPRQRTHYELDLHTGKLLAQGRGGTGGVATIAGSAIALEVTGATAPAELVRADTPGVPDADPNDGCVVGDDYLTIVDGALVAFRTGSSPRTIGQPFSWRSLRDPPPLVLRCSHLGTRAVVFAYVLSASGPQANVVVIVLDESGTDIIRIALASTSDADRDRALLRPLRDRLTRFVPYNEEGTRLVVDLASGHVVWSRGAASRATSARFPRGRVTQIANGDRWIVLDDTALMTFDGTTGALLASRTVPTSADDTVVPSHVADNTLWVYSDALTTTAQIPYAVLDATTLQPRFNRGVELHDLAIVPATADQLDAAAARRTR